MTGPEHYEEAQRLLRDIVAGLYKEGRSFCTLDQAIARARVHATLALAAVTVGDSPEWALALSCACGLPMGVRDCPVHLPERAA